MADQKPGKQETLAREIIRSIDELLAAGDWEATLFLKANKKHLEALKQRAQALLEDQTLVAPKQATREREPPAGYKVVYISLFQAESNNLIKWQGAIKGLERYSVSRPIYSEEAHVRALIRNKPDPQKEAYVIAFVKESDIIKPYLGKKNQDRWGHELLTLREQAVDLGHVIEFIHDNKHYLYSKERGLVLV